MIRDAGIRGRGSVVLNTHKYHISKVTAAEILRIEDALRSMFPDLSVYIKSLKEQIAAERTALSEMNFE